MKKYVLISIVFCLMLSGCVGKSTSQLSEDNSPQTSVNNSTGIEDHSKINLQVGDTSLTVEAVTSLESITKGLGERQEIGSDGMLFFLPDRRIATFWMKGMSFDLDMVWIDGNKVVGVTANVPVHTVNLNFPTYASPSEVTQVLELPAGDAQKRGIKAGDQVLVTSN